MIELEDTCGGGFPSTGHPGKLSMWPKQFAKNVAEQLKREAFNGRDPIDHRFFPGDSVRLISDPSITGVVEDGTSVASGVAMVPQFPNGMASFCDIEHAPDPDGVTRYHDDTGLVFAEMETIDPAIQETVDEIFRRETAHSQKLAELHEVAFGVVVAVVVFVLLVASMCLAGDL